MMKIFISTALLACAFAAAGQHRLAVDLAGREDQPLENATVSIGAGQGFGSQVSLRTDRHGSVLFPHLPKGQYALRASHVGYRTLDTAVLLASDRRIAIRLLPAPVRTEEVLVTATRARSNASTTFANLDREAIQRANLGRDLPYLLAQTPSVVVGSDAGNGIGYTNITIRGANSQRINVTLDGIPLNDAESMETYLVNLPDFASSVESIQIQRGIGTSTNGAGAFGASLNVQTEGLREKPYAELSNSIGSYRSRKNTLKLGSGLVGGRYALNARLSAIASAGYVERASSDLKSFYVDGGVYGQGQTLRATLFSGRERTYQAWYGTPEPLLKGDRGRLADYASAMEIYGGAELDRLQRAGRTYNYYTYDNQTDNYAQTHARLHYNRYGTGGLDFSAALHYTRGAGYYEEFRPDDRLAKYGMKPVQIGGETVSKSDLVRRRWLDNHFYGATYALGYAPAANLKMTFGGAYNRYLGGHYGEVIWSRFASDSQPGDRYYANNARKNDFSLYGKMDYGAGKWLFNIDLQYRALRYRANGDDDKAKGIAVRDGLHFFNPKAGITYRIGPAGNAYLSYAFASKEPVRKDYVENPLDEFPRPERMQDIEAGYRYAGSSVRAAANLYAMIYKDQLIPTGAVNEWGSTIRQNVPDSYRAGLEMDLAWQMAPRLTWTATAAISQHRIRDFREYVTVYDNDWNELERREIIYPKTSIALSAATILTAGLAYRPLAGMELSLQGKHVSRLYLDNTQHRERSVDPFTLADLGARYGLSAFGLKNVDLLLQVNNLLGTEYETGGYTYGWMDAAGKRAFYNFYTPQATRNYMAGLNVRF